MPKIPPLRWSRPIERIFNQQVGSVVMNRSTPTHRLGILIRIIPSEVLQMGRANFSEGYSDPQYGDLTADEKVLLYCFFCMKSHFFETWHNFRAHKTTLKKLIGPAGTVLLDLGCGPGTAGLAFAECFPGAKIQYVGLDDAPPMQARAKAILNQAIEVGALDAKSTVEMRKTWDGSRKLVLKKRGKINVIVNATYLFASDSLVVSRVTKLLSALKSADNVGALHMVYSNSTNALAEAKFEEFAESMDGEFESDGREEATVEFFRRRGDSKADSSTYNRQYLIFK